MSDVPFTPRWDNGVYVEASLDDLRGGVFKVADDPGFPGSLKLVREDGALFWLNAEGDRILVTTNGEDD